MDREGFVVVMCMFFVALTTALFSLFYVPVVFPALYLTLRQIVQSLWL